LLCFNNAKQAQVSGGGGPDIGQVGQGFNFPALDFIRMH
jgi:hypothetical protein